MLWWYYFLSARCPSCHSINSVNTLNYSPTMCSIPVSVGAVTSCVIFAAAVAAAAAANDDDGDVVCRSGHKKSTH